MIHIAFCDDSSEYRAVFDKELRLCCEKVFAGAIKYQIEPGFEDASSVLAYIKHSPIDLLFLDVDMPGMSGFDLAKALLFEHKQTLIVFMSAFDNFVYNSFEYYPFAFLRKDCMKTELPAVLKRVLDKVTQPDRIIELPTTAEKIRIDTVDILYAESERNYLHVLTVYGKDYLSRLTMAEFEALTAKHDFFRIHSAFLVNFEHVERILPNGCVQVGKKELPIAQRRLKAFKSAYMDYTRRCFGA